MSEKYLKIPVEGAILEGLYDDAEGAADAVVVCHPHPLYGGSMDNNVVIMLQEVLRSRSMRTLRFNSRGTGGSSGHFDQGEKEADDIAAVTEKLKELGAEAVHVAGYSFGAWVVLKALNKGLQAASVILVSPPLDFLEFSGLPLPDAPCFILVGDDDGFCSIASLNHWITGQKTTSDLLRVEILEGCDHFYFGNEARAAELLRKWLPMV